MTAQELNTVVSMAAVVAFAVTAVLAVRVDKDLDLLAAVQSAITVEPTDVVAHPAGQRGEGAAHHDLPVGLHRHAGHTRAGSWIESGVRCAIGVEPAGLGRSAYKQIGCCRPSMAPGRAAGEVGW